MPSTLPTVVRDDAGHLWQPRIDADLIRFANERLGLDLARIAGGNPDRAIARLTRDLSAFGSVLFMSVADQAAEQSVSPDAFARLMRGADGKCEVLERLSLAFVGALGEFYPDSRLGRVTRFGRFPTRS